MEIVDRMSLIEWLANNYKTFGKFSQKKIFYIALSVERHRHNQLVLFELHCSILVALILAKSVNLRNLVNYVLECFFKT